MSTEVRVTPAGHRIEVQMHRTAGYDSVVLEPASPPTIFYIWTGMHLVVREIEAAAAPNPQPKE